MANPIAGIGRNLPMCAQYSEQTSRPTIDGTKGTISCSICGACVQEAQLTFRTQAAPLSGVLFALPRQEQQRREQSESAPLILMQPGRFQQMLPPAIDELATNPYLSSATQAFTT